MKLKAPTHLPEVSDTTGMLLATKRPPGPATLRERQARLLANPPQTKPTPRPEPTLPLNCELFELTEVGARHWLAMGAWSIPDAALLLVGANPKRIAEFDKDPFVLKPDYTSCGYVGVRDRLQNDFDLGALAQPCPPLKIIAWAASKHWIPDVLTAQLSDQVHAELARPAATEQATPAPPVPTPLTTGDIAHCFDSLRWNESEWKKPLGDKPKWLAECVAIPGQRGVSETRWNPVLIGAALVQQGHATARNVRSKFQTVDLLKPWFEVWKTYEADNLETL